MDGVVAGIPGRVSTVDELLGRPPFANPSTDEIQRAARALLTDLQFISRRGRVSSLANLPEITTTLPILCASLVEGSPNKKPCLVLYSTLVQAFSLVAQYSTYPVANIVQQAEEVLSFSSTALFEVIQGCGAMSTTRLCRFLNLDETAVASLNSVKAPGTPAGTTKQKKKGQSNSCGASTALAGPATVPVELLTAVLSASLPPDCQELLLSQLKGTDRFLSFVNSRPAVASAALQTFGALILDSLTPEALLPTLCGDDVGFLIDCLSKDNSVSTTDPHSQQQQQQQQTKKKKKGKGTSENSSSPSATNSTETLLAGLLTMSECPTGRVASSKESKLAEIPPLFTIPEQQWNYEQLQDVMVALYSFKTAPDASDCFGFLIVLLMAYRTLTVRGAEFIATDDNGTSSTTPSSVATWKDALWHRACECAISLSRLDGARNCAAFECRTDNGQGKQYRTQGNERMWLLPMYCLANWRWLRTERECYSPGTRKALHNDHADADTTLLAFLRRLEECLSPKIRLVETAAGGAGCTAQQKAAPAAKASSKGSAKQKSKSTSSAENNKKMEDTRESGTAVLVSSLDLPEYLDMVFRTAIAILSEQVFVMSDSVHIEASSAAVPLLESASVVILSCKAKLAGLHWPFYKSFLNLVAVCGWTQQHRASCRITSLHPDTSDNDWAAASPAKMLERGKIIDAALFCTRTTSRFTWLTPFLFSSTAPSKSDGVVPHPPLEPRVDLLRIVAAALPSTTTSTSVVEACAVTATRTNEVHFTASHLDFALHPLPPLLVFSRLYCCAATEVREEAIRLIAKEHTQATALIRLLDATLRSKAQTPASDTEKRECVLGSRSMEQRLQSHPLLASFFNTVPQEVESEAREERCTTAESSTAPFSVLEELMSTLFELRESLIALEQERIEAEMNSASEQQAVKRAAAERQLAEEQRLAEKRALFERMMQARQREQEIQVAARQAKLRRKQEEEAKRKEAERVLREQKIAEAKVRMAELSQEKLREQERVRKERLRRYTESMEANFRIGYFLEQLGFPPARIVAIREELRDVADSITPDDLLEYVVTGEKRVPADMLKRRDGQSCEEPHAASDGNGDFWNAVLADSGAAAATAQDTQITEQNGSRQTSAPGHSFHYRVRRLLDTFSYEDGDEYGNLPARLPTVKVRSLQKLWISSRGAADDFQDLAVALHEMKRRRLITSNMGTITLTVLGFRYHYPFHNPDAVMELALLERRQRVTDALTRQRHGRRWGAPARDDASPGAGSINNSIQERASQEDPGRDDEEEEETEDSTEENSDTDEYSLDDDDDESEAEMSSVAGNQILPDIEFGI